MIVSQKEPTMSKPHVAQKAPFPVKVEEGKSYSWCTCGKSEKQPFCDGAHKNIPGTGPALVRAR